MLPVPANSNCQLDITRPFFCSHLRLLDILYEQLSNFPIFEKTSHLHIPGFSQSRTSPPPLTSSPSDSTASVENIENTRPSASRSLVRMDTTEFHGNPGDDAEDLLSQIEIYLISPSQNLEEEKMNQFKKSIFKRALRGNAKTWFDKDLDPSLKTSWPTIEKAFTEYCQNLPSSSFRASPRRPGYRQPTPRSRRDHCPISDAY